MITGKKINELNSIIDPTLETVLPAVKIEGSTISDTAGKLTIQDLKTLSQQGVAKNPNIVTDLTSTTISIDNLLPNTIYQYNTLSSLTISNFIVSYELSSIYFKTSNSSFNLTFTNQPVWIDGSQPTFELNKEYILNIKNGIVWVQGIKVDSAISVIDINSFPATLSTNTNYTATLNGSATFTLPTPSDTSIENTINLLLNVSVNSTVDWGVNANSVLSSFTAGKYEIRLRYNNSTSNWIGEVLKAEEAPNPVKLYVPFNNTAEDLSNNPVSLSANNTSDNFPEYLDRTTPEGYVGTKALKMVVNNNFHWFTPSNNLSKLNLGTGDFSIMLWAKASSSGFYWEINALRVDSNNYLSIGRFTIEGTTIIDLQNYWSGITDNEWHHFCWTRSGNTWRGFIDGVLKKTATSSASVDFSSVARIAYLYYSFGPTVAEIQELIVKNTCDYITDFTPPTAPYVLTDNSLADYHDDTKQNDLTTIKGFNASATQTLKNINGVIQWVTD